MTRFLIYLFPIILDAVIASTLFVCRSRVKDARDSALPVTGVMTAWALGYAVFAQVAGTWVTAANAAWMLIGSCLATVACLAALVMFPGLIVMYPLVFLLGVAGAFFFLPFQMFMKTVEHGRPQGIIRSVALYNFAWSAGYAAGPFLAGPMCQYTDWRWCYLVVGAFTIVAALGILWLRHLAHVHPDAPAGKGADTAQPPPAAPNEYAGMPDMAWLAWVGAGLGVLALSMTGSVFQYSAKAFSVSELHQGMILGLLSAVQALTALCLIRGRAWMYRPLPLAAFGLIGVAGLLLLGYARGTPAFYQGAGLLGIYTGAMFMYFVFHSLVHPSRSARYVSINESVVGVCAIVGPLLAGALADWQGPSSPYFAAAGVIGAVVILKVVVHQRHTSLVRRHLLAAPQRGE